MKSASNATQTPAQTLVDFFKKTRNSDLILAKTEGNITILYAQRPSVIHSLRKHFSDDYAKKIQDRQQLARDTITKFIDIGRAGDQLSNRSAKQIKDILGNNSGEIKAGKLKELFEALNPQTSARRALAEYANETWDFCFQALGATKNIQRWEAPLILQAAGNISDSDTVKLKEILTAGQPLSQTESEELEQQIDALKKFMKQKGAKELDRIDFQRIHTLAMAWRRANPQMNSKDQPVSEKSPLAVACFYLSNFGKSAAEALDIDIVSGSLGLYPSDVTVISGKLDNDDAVDLASSAEKQLINRLPDSKKVIGDSDVAAVQVRISKSKVSSTLIKLPCPLADGGAFPMQQLRQSYKKIHELISTWRKQAKDDPEMGKRAPTRSLLISPIKVEGSESSEKMLQVFAEELLKIREAMPELKITVRETPEFSRVAILEALNSAASRDAKATNAPTN